MRTPRVSDKRAPVPTQLLKSPAMGLIRGFAAPFRAAAFVSRERMWHLVLFPVVLNAALATASAWAAEHYWHEEIRSWGEKWPALRWLFLVVMTGLLGLALFIVLQPLVGAILNDRLCEKVERRLLGEAPRPKFFASSGRALAHGLLKLILYALALVIGLVLGAITGVGGAIGVILAGLFLAYDGFDYPLARRSATFGAKWRYLVLHPGQTIGYGVGATVLYLFPLAFVVAPSLAAVGATLAYVDDQNRKQQKQLNKGSAA